MERLMGFERAHGMAQRKERRKWKALRMVHQMGAMRESRRVHQREQRMASLTGMHWETGLGEMRAMGLHWEMSLAFLMVWWRDSEKAHAMDWKKACATGMKKGMMMAHEKGQQKGWQKA